MKTNMKKGITLIEIILAIVLIAVILGITIPKLMSNSAKAEIKQVIASDVTTIVKACKDWRKSSAAANSSFKDLATSSISSRLPSNVSADGTNMVIWASGLRTGRSAATSGIAETGIYYIVKWQLNSTEDDTKPRGRFSIAISTEKGVKDLGWTDKIRDYANDILKDTVAEMTAGANPTAFTSNEVGSVENYKVKCNDTTVSVCYELLELN